MTYDVDVGGAEEGEVMFRGGCALRIHFVIENVLGDA